MQAGLDLESLRPIMDALADLRKQVGRVETKVAGREAKDMRAWIYQDAHQVKKVGADKASYYVGWVDPAKRRRCKSCGPGAAGRQLAKQLMRKVSAELTLGTYGRNLGKTWAEFMDEFEAKCLDRMAPGTQQQMRLTLKMFEELCKPGQVSGITTSTVDDFAAKRRAQGSRRVKGEPLGAVTVNNGVRRLRLALRKAHRWGYLEKLPEFDLAREPERIPNYVTPEDLAKLYAACGSATEPVAQGYTPADWWRALLVTGYLTGWRRSEILGLRRDDVDLDTGGTLLRAEITKGKRDARLTLHPLVTDHLRRLVGFEPEFFAWQRSIATLYRHLEALCVRAGTPRYGFHDLRRAFATLNADRVSVMALKELMRHRQIATTMRYVNMAHAVKGAVEVIYVPDLKAGTG